MFSLSALHGVRLFDFAFRRLSTSSFRALCSDHFSVSAVFSFFSRTRAKVPKDSPHFLAFPFRDIYFFFFVKIGSLALCFPHLSPSNQILPFSEHQNMGAQLHFNSCNRRFGPTPLTKTRSHPVFTVVTLCVGLAPSVVQPERFHEAAQSRL